MYFLSLFTAVNIMKKPICLDIFVAIRQTVEYRTPVLTLQFSWRLHITITYNLPHLRLWYVDVVTVIAYTPEVVCLTFQTSRHEKDGHGRNWHDSKQAYCFLKRHIRGKMWNSNVINITTNTNNNNNNNKIHDP